MARQAVSANHNDVSDPTGGSPVGWQMSHLVAILSGDPHAYRSSLQTIAYLPQQSNTTVICDMEG